MAFIKYKMFTLILILKISSEYVSEIKNMGDYLKMKS